MPGRQQIALDSDVVVTTEQVASDLGDEIAILGLRRNTYNSVTGTGRRIWELLQTRRTVSEILAALLAQYAVDAERCRDDLLALLEKLHQEGLIEVGDGSTP